jgi:hypothetical protein
MSARFTLVVLIVCAVCFAESIAKTRTQNTEAADIRRGEQAVLTSLATAASPKSALLCVDKPIVCVGPEKWELGLSLLAARNTPASLRAVASLVRYQLDGGLGEEYDTLLVGKGRIIESHVASLSPEDLHQKCQKEFADLMKASGSALGEMKVEMVCRSPQAIATDVQHTLDAIRHPRTRQY